METITQMIAYCGFPAATNALLTAKELFEQLDKNADSAEVNETRPVGKGWQVEE